MEQESDEALIKRFKDDDHHAFELFVRRHQDRIYRLACVYARSSDDASDITQEVFLRAYKGLQGFRFGAKPFTWLYKVLKNVCNEFNRKSDRHVELNQEMENQLVETPQYDKCEKSISKIRQLVEELPLRQREVVVLRIFEELTIEETATVMRCRPGTVKANLHKALRNLRTQIDIGYFEEY